MKNEAPQPPMIPIEDIENAVVLEFAHMERIYV